MKTTISCHVILDIACLPDIKCNKEDHASKKSFQVGVCESLSVAVFCTVYVTTVVKRASGNATSALVQRGLKNRKFNIIFSVRTSLSLAISGVLESAKIGKEPLSILKNFDCSFDF
jgi:hypothetical protein